MGTEYPRRMNWAQLRHKIDAGETRDKVRWSDPAVAPLGTDEEAGGASTAPEDIAASAQEQARGTAHGPSPGRTVVIISVAGLLVILLALLLVLASSR